MTAEVCLMNRLAVVLAADSATTVTRWGDNGREERYFKGANKIFQLSNHHAIGLMIYDSADLLNVPWEVITKEFRKHIGEKSFNHVGEYAEEFFLFIDESGWLFPTSVQKEFFLDEARKAGLQPLMHAEIDASMTDDEKRNIVNTALDERTAKLDTLPLLRRIDADRAADVAASYKDELEAMVADWLPGLDLAYVDRVAQIAINGINEMLKAAPSFVGCTGLVFAGFGDRDPFPAMIQYQCSGIIAGKLAAHEEKRAAIDHSKPAWISAFAQTAMSDTFTLGLSQDVYASIIMSLADGLGPFAEEVARQSGGDLAAINDLDALVNSVSSKISKAVLDQATRDHAAPMRSILSVLPVDEMAELAETLINLQSLKEKVTKPSETVGGPVDVAVITRGEGLVWIKRKHFFPTELNSRYLARLATVYK